VSFSPRVFFTGRMVRILACVLAAFFYLVFLLATLPAVPFHPDEATYIFMSRDLDRILSRGPLSVCWRPGGAADPLQVERERDCPLTRYAVGLARLAGGLAATDANWNWSLDWDRNLEQGAVPSDELLFRSRIPSVLLLFLSVLLMARIGLRLGGKAGAVSAAVIFGFNSQILLHGRRAMSEAGLLFGMILVAAVLLEQRRNAGPLFRDVGRPLLAGAALAVAASAKHSGLLMAPVAVAGMFWIDPAPIRWKTLWHGAARTGVMILGFLALFLALNPVYWCDPPGTLAAVVAERQRLMGEQIQAVRSAAPAAVLDSIPARLMAPLYEWFVAPLAFWDIPNYASVTAAAEKAYLALPLHTLTAGRAGSLLSAVLTFFGLGWAVARSAARRTDTDRLVAPVWFLVVSFGITAGVPILWQRYYLPLIPAAAALSAGSIGAITTKLAQLNSGGKNRQD
jgi:4-amino-4-deoxy-L-arabinose transferase-like glycosyltransferase